MEKGSKDMIGEIIEAFEKYEDTRHLLLTTSPIPIVNCLKLYIKYPL